MTSRLLPFRQHRDEYFAQGENSPIDEAGLQSFTALDYFDENPDLVFELEIDTASQDSDDHIILDTSDGERVEFARAGRVSFTVGDQNVQLTVLKDLDRGRFFLPFTDATTGEQTYECGRYLDPRLNRDGMLTVDFNYAYNPYCAYSDGWSCPLPPAENALKAPIEAGEKKYTRASPSR